MVSGSRFDGGTQSISARVQKTIESIKEIVGNHSDADIYIMLKETNMDPNETAQKLLNQDPFHEVKRKRDKKKENTGYGSSVEPIKHTVHVDQGMKSQTFFDHNIRRGSYSRNSGPGVSREFRIVRDNRVNQNTNREIKPESFQWTTSTNEKMTPAASGKSSTVIVTDQKPSGAKNSEWQKPSQVLNGPSDLGPRHAQVANSNGTLRKEFSGDARSTISNSASRVQGPRTHDSQTYSATLASNNPVVGVYSSSTDPVHVPSPDSRSSVTVGAIRREVGVVGVRKQPSENSVKSSGTSNSFSTPVLGKDFPASTESFQPSAVSQSSAPESVMSSVAVSRSFVSNQYHSKPHQQVVGHQKAPQTNMEWKPKSFQKSSPGVIGSAASISPPADNSSELKSEAAHLQDKLSRVNIFDNQHVVIPSHLRVPEADRMQLTFGSFGAGFDSTRDFVSGFKAVGSVEESNGEPSVSASSSVLEASSEDVSGGNQIELVDDQVNSISDYPASVAAFEQPLPDKKESSSPPTLESYEDIGLVHNVSPPFACAEQQQQQDPSGLPSFSAYDPQTGYDVPFFRPGTDENVRGQGLPSPHEALSSHTANSIPASTVAMVQQQPVTQLYPQVHVSHFPNFMPYRPFLSPVYVPPMAVPGYSSNAAYPPHPSNGSSYLLMPGGSSHLTAGGLKYGSQQYKPVPAGSATTFGNYANLAGYAVNAPGAAGSATGLDDSTRIKYKEGNLYVPNPQAETSEMWIQTPRDHPGLQSTPYYNVPGQVPHATYLPSHTGHASFNAAAAQSTHLQFPGLYHPPQPTAIANPHHMVPGMGGNVGVGMAAPTPGAQVGAYQQPQLSHLNWTTNF
ncbi:GBF-interacting protein 1-like isoform X2 [Telopea speciosissima]|uniref:GBF-interacting protein 1-like isoform X2 n=1 Tax=Telopea speciosissima TaxID=54955 RepID=UPI001CC40AB2|nr:GBF-interacting protein 1-like isoform X2 [Telopea speciosissima]